MRKLYYKTSFWVCNVIWPWFQVYFLRRKILRWKILPLKIIIDPDMEITITVAGE